MMNEATKKLAAAAAAGARSRYSRRQQQARLGHRPVKHETPEEWGPRRWARLHYYPRLWTNPEAAREWFGRWLASIPRTEACGCQESTLAIVSNNPPDFSSPDALFRYGVKLHNLVNAKLGKSQFPLESAENRYGYKLAA